MERQLIKVAKELNVGMGTVAEYLLEKGFDVDNKPNARISDDMYNAVIKKFSDSKAEKQQADQMVIGTRPVIKPMTPSVPSTFNAPLTPPPVQERRTISLFPTKETPKIEEKPVERPKTPEFIERVKPPMPVILGKIDLNPPKKETPPQPVVKQPETVKQPDMRNQGQQKQPETPRTDFKKPETRQGDNNRNDQQRSDRRPDDRRREPPRVFVPEAPKAQVAVEPVQGATENTELAVQYGETDLIRGEAPQLRGLKIKGKIDIDKFLEKEKEINKPKGRNDNRGGVAGNNNNRRRGDNRGPIVPGGDRTRPPLAGAKLPDGTTAPITPRPPLTAAEQEARKRKRKRKKLPDGTSAIGGAGGTSGGNNTNRPATTGGAGGGVNRPVGGQNRPGDNRGGQNRPTTGRGEPVPISQQQIEAKIKETMARLNVGGKNKGQKIRRDKREKNREREEMRQMEKDGAKLQVTEFVSVSDLASLMNISPTQIITTCMSMGIFVSINQRLDAELIEVIAGEFDQEVEFISAEEQVGAVVEEEIDDPADLLPRAPVVTIMGHVDHGKTSLLDNVRKANVASGEAGGITQHIGAYEVKMPDGRKITFLDTPGHEAFTAMRARGAKVTDVAVVIIAADDNIMPQTKEAISHAQAAGVPIVFAINKIDKAGADPARIKNELAQMNLLVEEWGGKYQSQDISAKQGVGIDELMEKILLEAEVLDLKANPDKRASGAIIEASLDKGRGYVSKMLVQGGTLKIGDPMVCGEHAGKVKAMFNERGKKVFSAGPATPVLVLGLSGAPQAGDNFKVMPSESEAKEIANKRAQIVREQSARATKRISLDEIGRRLALGTFKELKLIIKGDVDGSVEALSDSLLKQSHETVQVNVIHKAVGAITESDILLASASDAIVIGFQVRPSIQARKLAEREGVEIKMYSIIYEAINEIRAAIEGMLEPTKEEKILGSVEVREVYKISKIGTIAGCYVTEGKIERKNLIRIIRDGIVVFPAKEGATAQLGSLKRFKDDAKEVKFGFECGITIDNYNDIQVGDFIEPYEIIEVKQKLAAQK